MRPVSRSHSPHSPSRSSISITHFLPFTVNRMGGVLTVHPPSGSSSSTSSNVLRTKSRKALTARGLYSEST